MIPLGVLAASVRRGLIPPVDPTPAALFAKAVAWWDFDSDTVDAIHEVPTIAGSATYVPGKIGNMAVKGGLLRTDVLVRPTPVSGGVTFGGWIYIQSGGDENPIVLKVSADPAAAGNLSHYLAVRSGGTQLILVGYPVSGGNVSISTATGALAVGNFYFIAASVGAGGAMKLYLNDTEVASGTIPGATAKDYSHAEFGKNAGGQVWNALLNDSSFIFDGVLSPEEIAWLYNGGAGRGSADLLEGSPYPPAKRLGSGAWTWYNDPRAIYAAATDHLVVGFTDSDGTLACYQTDSDLAPPTRFNFTGTSTQPDDHDNPALLELADGSLLAFYTRHSDVRYWVRKSASSGDGSAWDAAVDVDPQMGGDVYSYCNPVQLEGESGAPIHNFTRVGATPNFTMHHTQSSDGGATWTPATPLLPGGRPYMKVVKNGPSRIDFLVTDAHPTVATTSVYHFYYEGGGYFDSFGTSLGAAPFAFSALTKLWDGTTPAGRGWVWDIQIGSDGHPAVAYSVYPSTTDHRYRYARFNGTAWVQSEVCPGGTFLYSGEPYYSAGLCIDPGNVSKVYAISEASGFYTLRRFTTSNGGASFDAGTPLYVRGGGRKAFRPYVVKGANVLLFVAGEYTTYSDFRTSIYAVKI